jgi:hypothetical protein
MGRGTLILGCVLVVLGMASVSAAAPPRPGTTDSGLNESEEATLWSNVPAGQWEPRPGEDTTIHELTTATDLTFTQPPGTADRWNPYAHGEFRPGGRAVSVHPDGSETYDHEYIKDAHATIFAVNPSTRLFVSPDDSRLYVAPEGTLRGAIDYRIELPEETSTAAGTRSYRLLDDEVRSVEFHIDDEHEASADGTKRPTFEYDLGPGSKTLTLDARIEATVQETVRPPPRSNQTTRTTTHTVWLDVWHSLDVAVYQFQPAVSQTEFPDGSAGVVISQNYPWQGITLARDGPQRVRGVWRFFMARNPGWQRLVESREAGTTSRDSHALPVSVYAYPSSMRPQAIPRHAGPDIEHTWGATHDTPASALPENVGVDVIEGSYNETYGMAIRADSIDPDEITIGAIVHGMETTPWRFFDEPKQVRETTLSASIIDETGSNATVLVELTDAATGEPIELGERSSNPAIPADDEYIEIGDRRVQTNASGLATVTLAEPGVYTVRYEPTPWYETREPHAGARATIHYNPLLSPMAWLTFGVRVGVTLLPFAIAWYAGRRLASMFSLGDRR